MQARQAVSIDTCQGGHITVRCMLRHRSKDSFSGHRVPSYKRCQNHCAESSLHATTTTTGLQAWPIMNEACMYNAALHAYTQSKQFNHNY